MRPLWLALALAGCSAPHFPESPPPDACAAGAVAPGEYVLSIEVGGLKRTGLVWMPEGPGPHDVVIDFHEHGAEPRRQAHYSKWFAEKEGQNVILVGPDGKSATWNAGGCCGKAREKRVDDVAFLDALAERVNTVGCGSGRVLATGIGAGGMMAEGWACESEVPDAVVSVGGALQIAECKREAPLPLLHYHGDADKWMPADGSMGHRPVDLAEATWTQVNGGGEPVPSADGDLSCRRRSGRAELVYCTAHGLADQWPGAEGAVVKSQDPLADATIGGWAWVKAQWSKPE